MANVQSPRGLRVAGPLLGSHYYPVASTYATALYLGDPVLLTGTSNNVTVAAAGSGNAMCGAVIGVYDSDKIPGTVNSSGVRVNYKVASVAAYVLVADHPMQLFISQGDGDTSFLDMDDCGGNIPMVASTAGSTLSGQSAWTLDDSATAGTSTADQIRLVRPVDRVDNTVAIAYCDWYCFINNHQRNASVVGAAV